MQGFLHFIAKKLLVDRKVGPGEGLSGPLGGWRCKPCGRWKFTRGIQTPKAPPSTRILYRMRHT